MVGWLRAWWQKIKKYLKVIGIVVAIAVVIALVVAIIGGYIFNWPVVGLGPYIPPTKDSGFQRGKTLWDWLQLLIVPAVIAFGGLWFAQTQHRNEQTIASDNQREAALQDYIDKMSELLLHEKLRKSELDSEVRNIARVPTLNVLSRLDKERKRSVLQFLYESSLIKKDK